MKIGVKGPSRGTVRRETSIKDNITKKVTPITDEEEEIQLPGLPKPGEYIGYVTFRAGSTIGRKGTFSSVTCHVEVTLPVALPNPVRGKGLDDEGQRRINKAISAASDLAGEAYAKEAEALKEVLDED